MARLLVLSIFFAAPVSAQLISAPRPLAAGAIVAPLQAPPLASQALPAELSPSFVTPAPAAAVLGDPVLTDAVLARAQARLPDGGVEHAALRRALQAGDYTGAREILKAARLDVALNAPDHPEVARLRRGVDEARHLIESGEQARAMERVSKLFEAYEAGRLAHTENRHAFRRPLSRLKAELEKSGSAAYFRPRDARAHELPVAARDIHAWLAGRADADGASVAGDFPPAPIALQRWGDCAVNSIWNLPALSSLRARFGSYDKFLSAAEDYLGQTIRRDGLSDGDSRRLLRHWGWDRPYDHAPRGEEALAAEIRARGGVLGSYSFRMPLLTALRATASFNRAFEHAVAISAAVFDHGRWWFVVLDSRFENPRVLSYGELLTLHLEIASVKPL